MRMQVWRRFALYLAVITPAGSPILAGSGVDSLRSESSQPNGEVARSDYYVAYQPDLHCYPNYSFEIGDLDGDGRAEFVCLDQTGNLLRAIDLKGRILFEKQLTNNGTWGTPLIAIADLNGDGRAEVAVPASTDRLELLNGKGEKLAEYVTGATARDDYGIGIPLVAPFRCSKKPGLVIAVAGGRIVALDGTLKELWRKDGFRHDFGHEFYIADLDGDGLDEVAFCTLDHIRGWGKQDVGELVVLDHDGCLMLREPVNRYYNDTHFDDVAAADFRGIGRTELMLEKGILIDLHGDVIWDATKNFEHGQWIAHFPDPSGKGRRIVIAELWGKDPKNVFLSSDGKVLAAVKKPSRTQLDPSKYPGWSVLPTRCHIVQWTPNSAPEVFLGEQAVGTEGHACTKTVGFDLKVFFLDTDGRLRGILPFHDRRIKGYWYNGEVHSRVADVDNDGCQEVVFPCQDGRVMVIKKR
jgi:hypothetical protein